MDSVENTKQISDEPDSIITAEKSDHCSGGWGAARLETLVGALRLQGRAR